MPEFQTGRFIRFSRHCSHVDEASPRPRTQAYPRIPSEAAAEAVRRARWLARYEEVRRRVQAGEKLLAISRAVGLYHITISPISGKSRPSS